MSALLGVFGDRRSGVIPAVVAEARCNARSGFPFYVVLNGQVSWHMHSNPLYQDMEGARRGIG